MVLLPFPSINIAAKVGHFLNRCSADSSQSPYDPTCLSDKDLLLHREESVEARALPRKMYRCEIHTSTASCHRLNDS